MSLKISFLTLSIDSFMHCLIKFFTFVCCKYYVFLHLSFSGCKNLQSGLVQAPAMCAKHNPDALHVSFSSSVLSPVQPMLWENLQFFPHLQLPFRCFSHLHSLFPKFLHLVGNILVVWRKGLHKLLLIGLVWLVLDLLLVLYFSFFQ